MAIPCFFAKRRRPKTSSPKLLQLQSCDLACNFVPVSTSEFVPGILISNQRWLLGTFLQNGDLHKLFLRNYSSYNAVTWHGTFYLYAHPNCSGHSDPQSKMAATHVFVKQQRLKTFSSPNLLQLQSCDLTCNILAMSIFEFVSVTLIQSQRWPLSRDSCPFRKMAGSINFFFLEAIAAMRLQLCREVPTYEHT